MDDQNQPHPYEPTVSFDGGDLDCGNGLLLLIRKHIDPLTPGQLLEILSTESSVVEDLPAWCRLTKTAPKKTETLRWSVSLPSRPVRNTSD